jgi:hypothetical protein
LPNILQSGEPEPISQQAIETMPTDACQFRDGNIDANGPGSGHCVAAAGPTDA